MTFKGVSSNDNAIGPIMVINDGLYFKVVRIFGPRELLEKLNWHTGSQKSCHTFHVSVFRIMQVQILSVTHVYEHVFTVRRRLINLAGREIKLQWHALLRVCTLHLLLLCYDLQFRFCKL
jgi:hypothetical protein